MPVCVVESDSTSRCVAGGDVCKQQCCSHMKVARIADSSFVSNAPPPLVPMPAIAQCMFGGGCIDVRVGWMVCADTTTSSSDNDGTHHTGRMHVCMYAAGELEDLVIVAGNCIAQILQKQCHPCARRPCQAGCRVRCCVWQCKPSVTVTVAPKHLVA